MKAKSTSSLEKSEEISLLDERIVGSQKMWINPNTGRLKVQTINTEPSLTQQQFKEECDINNIMEKHAKTGQYTHVSKKMGMYGDFTKIKEYKSMFETVMAAEESFMSLPAQTRKRFDNDPGKLIEFLQDEKNRDEGIKLGLLIEKQADDEQKIKTNDEKPVVK